MLPAIMTDQNRLKTMAENRDLRFCWPQWMHAGRRGVNHRSVDDFLKIQATFRRTHGCGSLFHPILGRDSEPLRRLNKTPVAIREILNKVHAGTFRFRATGGAMTSKWQTFEFFEQKEK